MCQDRVYYKLLLKKEQDPKLRRGPDVNSEDSSNHPHPPYPWAFSEKGWKNDGLSLGEKGSHYHLSTFELNYELIMHYKK